MLPSADNLFIIMNQFALTGWVLLIVLPNWKFTRWLVQSGAASLALCVVYLVLLIGFAPEANGGFSSLAGVRNLFSQPYILLAGWVHYLAFDLFIGAWISRDARALQISHWLLIPVLGLTFLFGPAGLLAYFVLRGVLLQRRQSTV